MAHELDDDTPLPEGLARDARRSAQAGPDAASRARIAAAVRARTSGGGPGGGSGGAGGRGGVWLAMAAFVALLAYVAWPRVSVAPSSRVDSSPAIDPVVEAPRVAAPAVGAPSVEAPPVVGPTPIDEPAPPHALEGPAARAPALPTEIELLDAAHGALVASPARALGYLERHASLYPNGLFEEEREALAIEALVRLDRSARAEARADRFFAAHPSTAHRAHLLELLRSTESSEAP